MARGKKNISLEEQLSKITIEINNMEDSLSKLKQTKIELEEQIKMSKLEELYELIQESGKNFDEVKEMLNKNI
jgi:hypothetical protein